MLSHQWRRAFAAGRLLSSSRRISSGASSSCSSSSSRSRSRSLPPGVMLPTGSRFSTSAPQEQEASVSSASESESGGGHTHTDPAAVPPLREDILKLAEKPRTGVSMMGMYRMGATSVTNARLMGAQFLHNELAIRMARSLKQLHDLPYGMANLPGVQRVRLIYEGITDVLIKHPRPTNEDEAKHFSVELTKYLQYPGYLTLLYLSHSVMQIRDTIFMKEPDHDRFYEEELLRQFIDDFYIGRIGIRMLSGQQAGLYTGNENRVGLIDPNCNPVVVVRGAIKDATAVCQRAYGRAPEVHIFCTDGPLLADDVAKAGEPCTAESESASIENLKFTYVPSVLQDMVFELLKNSMRAVVENEKGKGKDGPLPPISVAIASGAEDVTIKVSDNGGGISRNGLDRVMTYSYSTAEVPDSKTLLELDINKPDFTKGSNLPERDDPVGIPMAGYGYGLPLTKLNARYFGGELELMSVDGHGTDVFLYLSRIEHEELLDIR